MVNRIIVQTNDYFSWDVERLGEKDQIFNVVLCLMGERDVSEKEAITLLKSYIMKDELMYQSMLDDFYRAHPNLLIHMRKYIAAGPFFVGGNHYWSAACPRYKLPTAPEEKQSLEKSAEIEIVHVNPGSDEFGIDNPCAIVLPAKDNTLSHPMDDLGDSALLAVPRYIQSLPSKNIRSKLVDAFNVWF